MVVRAAALLAVLAAVVVVGVGPGSAATTPALKLVPGQPVAVRGTGFAAHERVRVVLRSPAGRTVRRTRANGRGAFSVRFPRASTDRCAGFSVSARGSRGSRAALPRRALAQCAF